MRDAREMSTQLEDARAFSNQIIITQLELKAEDLFTPMDMALTFQMKAYYKKRQPFLRIKQQKSQYGGKVREREAEEMKIMICFRVESDVLVVCEKGCGMSVIGVCEFLKF